MSQDKVFVIINPSSGMGKGGQVEEIIYQMWNSGPLENIPFDIANSTSQNQGSVETLVSMAKSAGYKRIILVGGDGSCHEAANVLAGSDASLGLIPAGVGNDFAKGLGIPLKPKEAVLNAFFGEEKLIDLGIVDDRFFLNVLSFCFDADIAKQMADHKKPSFPFPLGLYCGLVLKELLFGRRKFPRIRIVCDGKEREKETLALVVSNGPQYGAVFNIAPGASLTDGMLNVHWIEKMSNFSLVRTIPKVIQGRHDSMKQVETFEANSFLVSSSDILSCQIDGEVFSSKKEYRVGIQPKALRVVVPE